MKATTNKTQKNTKAGRFMLLKKGNRVLKNSDYFARQNDIIKSELLTVAGKTCDSIRSCQAEKSIVFEKKGHPITECKQCGHRFLPIEDVKNHVSEIYSDDYFFDGKEGYPNYLEQKDILLKYGVRYSKIVSKYTQPGRMLDVGSAAGFILKGFDQAGWECCGVEPNNTMAEYGRKELGLDIMTGSLENYPTTKKFDLVTMVQVIGHFYDLDKAMMNISALLNQDGFVLIESWNMNSLIVKMLGKSWHEYSPPSVVHWFSDRTLTELFNYYGFELIEKGYPAKKINTKHALSFFEDRFPDSAFKRKMFGLLNNTLGKMNLPYPPVDVKWYLFKKV
jgi:SAM-dependent methyltransferase